MIAMDMTTRYAMRYVMQAVVMTRGKNGHVFPSYNCHSILLSYLDFRLQLSRNSELERKTRREEARQKPDP